jgi:hypothetical protein
MGASLPRPGSKLARLDLPVEDWPDIDEAVLRQTRSRKVCMTCPWFRQVRQKGWATASSYCTSGHSATTTGARAWR